MLLPFYFRDLGLFIKLIYAAAVVVVVVVVHHSTSSISLLEERESSVVVSLRSQVSGLKSQVSRAEEQRRGEGEVIDSQASTVCSVVVVSS